MYCAAPRSTVWHLLRRDAGSQRIVASMADRPAAGNAGDGAANARAGRLPAPAFGLAGWNLGGSLAGETLFVISMRPGSARLWGP
jgi:hypothetical protein